MDTKQQGDKWLTQECGDCRLTELGARVLEILRRRWPDAPTCEDEHKEMELVERAARSLGLLDEEPFQ